MPDELEKLKTDFAITHERVLSRSQGIQTTEDALKRANPAEVKR
jgi:hypothetical protein